MPKSNTKDTPPASRKTPQSSEQQTPQVSDSEHIQDFIKGADKTSTNSLPIDQQTILAMQSRLGNQATQKLLQRYSLPRSSGLPAQFLEHIQQKRAHPIGIRSHHR